MAILMTIPTSTATPKAAPSGRAGARRRPAGAGGARRGKGERGVADILAMGEPEQDGDLDDDPDQHGHAEGDAEVAATDGTSGARLGGGDHELLPEALGV